ncbi:MAG: hypothetical protein NC310_02415 [Roseburia sp.]|nr:hypothetical protein [Anaeroplasma bactoclasticum]MCM1195910.1 hypothetical protein [Roseburia sp.]MCM1556602.1 hypothetical protein [Anaeroplasma bactoclasticum]
MNKKLITFLTENNFTIESESSYAFIDDYQVSISQERTENVLYGGMSTTILVFSHLEAEQIAPIQTFLKENKKSMHVLKYEVTELGVCIAVMNHYDTLMDTIKRITQFLSLQNTKNRTYCPITGEELNEETKRKLYYNNFVVFLNEASVELLNAQIEKAEQDFKNAPNHYLKGTLGAIVGGALGAVVWVVLGALAGVMSGWIAFLIAILAGLGYDKMKGKATNIKFVVAAIVTLCYVVISMMLVYILIVKSVMAENGLEGNPISVLFELMELNENVKSGFIADMILAVVFGTIGIFFSYFQMKKTVHKKQEKLK